MRHHSNSVPTSQPGTPAQGGTTTSDTIAAPIQESLAAARNRAADRKARWADCGGDPGPEAAATGPTSPPPARGRILKCRLCGRAEPRSAGDLKRLARGAWPMCCGQVMPPVSEPPAEAIAADAANDLPWADRRVADRRRARSGSRAELRRGLLGMSANLALKLIDVSEGGAQIRVLMQLRPGEQVEVALWPPGDVHAVRVPAVICWCLPTPTGEFRAGIRLRRRLDDSVVKLLAE